MPYLERKYPMRHLSTSPEATRLLRRSVWVVAMVSATVLLGGCSIVPKSWNFWSDDAEQTEPAPAPAPAAQVAPAPSVQAPAPEAQTNAVATPVVSSAEVTSTPAAESMKAAPAPTMATPTPADKPTAGAAAMQSKNPAVLVPGYYINVGLFAVPANGTKAYNKLETAGLPVFSDPVKKKDATVTRVRVGPFTTRTKADAAAKKIRALKLDAVIFKH
jgi:cell division septation protein DedD